ncbi:unnamed protein product [Triticum turgidum subsp. durum]|uniref:Strictosidine synthase conserved region domain-containing protein n=1 Tax=Triticum turgidum subsp. durum TaxID=4567 RepID=A0A9R0TPN9_TRITD|nr:unnamed protein product [Triticum turgidum subsp. durum]
MEEARHCRSATLLMSFLSLAFLIWPPPMAAATQEMKSIYAGSRVIPVRLARPAFGPESIVFDHRGGGPYTGVSNGRVVRWRGNRRHRGWTEFAHNYKHKTVAECAARKKVVEPESACGRPLGLQFHHASSDMYIADAYLGLMRVGRCGGLAEVVATEADGLPFNFLNGVDVDQETGDVYFTDSSTVYQRSEYMLVVLTGDATGRLMRYDPRTGNVTVLRSGLAFPNGVAVLADLPGYPDNVRPDGGGRGGYWVGMNRDKQWAESGTTANSMSAVRVVVATNGTVVEALRGFGDATVSEVVERNGSLWIGSVDTPYVGLFKLASLPQCGG